MKKGYITIIAVLFLATVSMYSGNPEWTYKKSVTCSSCHSNHSDKSQKEISDMLGKCSSCGNQGCIKTKMTRERVVKKDSVTYKEIQDCVKYNSKLIKISK